jgi:2-oxoglutarate dehydrogenase E1 component
MTRASQERRDAAGLPRQDDGRALPILIHGDAAFPGEGVTAETLNLSELPGYRTGGTIHIIVNNQLGFTTGPEEARSTLYASDLAKGFEIPIMHVNADDPVACIAAARLAHAYRTRFRKDVLIDLVGYRRWGHNEGDEPSFTQPVLYQRVDQHPSVRTLWAQALDREGLVPLAESDALLEAAIARLREINRASADGLPDEPGESDLQEDGDVSEITTAVPGEALHAYNEALLQWPAGFTSHPRLARLLERRRTALDPDGAIDWGLAETLAFAAILADGTPIRLTGQDTERGTFSQRHLVLHDVKSGQTYTPLQALPQARASFAVYNSPLSENGVLGFEYGYNGHAPETLVLWEAQFGDFANAAQVMIDQFIVAARAKWRQHPSLILLLPHGYEGQGPEHSNARPERFLQLAAQENLRIANLTTAAQYFHLLRCHAALLERAPRPLVLLTPKSLLRHPRAAARLEELSAGRFQPVLDDPEVGDRRDEITRLILCSGKVYVDLVTSDERAQATAVAIARVEQFYPFPAREISHVLAAYPHLREVVWMQEEPQNMGAWTFVAPRLRELIGCDIPLLYIGRPGRASTAVGSALVHAADQAKIVADAFADIRTLQHTM